MIWQSGMLPTGQIKFRIGVIGGSFCIGGSFGGARAAGACSTST